MATTTHVPGSTGSSSASRAAILAGLLGASLLAGCRTTSGGAERDAAVRAKEARVEASNQHFADLRKLLASVKSQVTTKPSSPSEAASCKDVGPRELPWLNAPMLNDLTTEPFDRARTHHPRTGGFGSPVFMLGLLEQERFNDAKAQRDAPGDPALGLAAWHKYLNEADDGGLDHQVESVATAWEILVLVYDVYTPPQGPTDNSQKFVGGQIDGRAVVFALKTQKVSCQASFSARSSEHLSAGELLQNDRILSDLQKNAAKAARAALMPVAPGVEWLF